ncbi:MAG: hypothetical protein ACRCV3_02340 [Desulfovibrionaceae bacterium]
MKDIQKMKKKLLSELECIAFTSIGALCTWDAEHIMLLPKETIPKKCLPAIAEIKESSTRSTLQVKLHSKLKALEILARCYGMYGDFEENITEDSITHIPEDILALLSDKG